MTKQSKTISWNVPWITSDFLILFFEWQKEYFTAAKETLVTANTTLLTTIGTYVQWVIK